MLYLHMFNKYKPSFRTHFNHILNILLKNKKTKKWVKTSLFSANHFLNNGIYEKKKLSARKINSLPIYIL